MEKKKKATTKKTAKAKVENKAVKTKKKVSYDHSKVYEFVSNGTFHTMPKGKVYTILGNTAETFVNAGYGKIKE